MAYQVSKSKFAELVERALSDVPEPFRGYLDLVPVQIEMRPSRALMRELEMDEDELLFGVYQGANLLEGSEAEGRGTPRPNHILIFQEDHEIAADSEAELVREVRKTVLHELGHHFGMSEEDLDRLGYG
jgi:predicted Zn-dependent protease with MMP-like domain